MTWLNSRCRSRPVSTILQKLVRVLVLFRNHYNMEIYIDEIIIIQGKWVIPGPGTPGSQILQEHTLVPPPPPPFPVILNSSCLWCSCYRKMVTKFPGSVPECFFCGAKITKHKDSNICLLTVSLPYLPFQLPEPSQHHTPLDCIVDNFFLVQNCQCLGE